MTKVYAKVPEPARSRGRIAPVSMGHIALKTLKLREMTDWYMAVLEAEVAFATDQLSFLAYDEEHHRVALVGVPELARPAGNEWGLDHISFSYRDIGELLATWKRLKEEHGIEPFWPIIHGPTISLYYRDPDGNKVELQIDVFPSIEAVNEFFASGAYEENWMGIIFDPAEMYEKHQAGVPLAELARRPKLPEGMSPWDMLRV